MSSTSLKSLLEQSTEIEMRLIETAGELTEEIEESLKLIELHLPQKVTNYMNLLDRLELEGDNLYSKAKKYEMAAKTLTGLRERLTSHVKAQMIEKGLEELRGKDESFSLGNGKKSVIVNDITKLPRGYICRTITERPDKEKIYNAIESGEAVPGCELQDTKTLRRKINKGIK
jgi:hypothetical protein